MTISSEYHLEQTFDNEVIEFTHLHNSNEWSKPLTNQQYVERESTLGQTDICSPNPKLYKDVKFRGLSYWVMKDLTIEFKQGDNPKTFNIVGACEALFRDGLIIRQHVQQSVLTPCIGGVYVQPNYRGLKIAEKMIVKLEEHLSSLSKDYFNEFKSSQLISPENMVTLYSEVGTYYERLNYISRPVRLIQIPSVVSPFNCNYEIIKESEFERFIDIYRNDLISSSISKSISQNQTVFLNVPSYDLVKWHHRRAVFISEKLNLPKPEKFGLKLDDSNFIIWTHDYNKKSLLVINLVSTSYQNLISLINSTLLECSKINFKNIIMWESDLNYDSILKNGEFTLAELIREVLDALINEKKGVFIANSSLPAFKFINQDNGDDYNDFIWEGNGKLPWF